MREFITYIDAFWPIFITLGGALIWLVRLEGKVSHNHERFGDLKSWSLLMEEKHNNLDSKIVNELSEIKQSLARLEGKLGIDANR